MLTPGSISNFWMNSNSSCCSRVTELAKSSCRLGLKHRQLEGKQSKIYRCTPPHKIVTMAEEEGGGGGGGGTAAAGRVEVEVPYRRERERKKERERETEDRQTDRDTRGR
jgi:hypothetical protein